MRLNESYEWSDGTGGDFPDEELTIRDIGAALRDGRLTSRELTLCYMERIAGCNEEGPELRAVLELNPEAVFEAVARDRELAEGVDRGPLHGVPILVKDNIDIADAMHTSAGSLALADHRAAKDAFLIRRLRDAGAVLLGKANMTELANFMTEGMPNGYSSRGGQTRSPYGPELNPGGSSSGSAVAVAANLCAAAVGTETCGSILHPACHNSVVGIKPTVGLISRSGIIPITYTQDTAGPLARTVEDAALLLQALTGVDETDPATHAAAGHAPADYSAYLQADGLKGARIGINRGYLDTLEADEAELFEQAVEALRGTGAVVVEGADLPHVAEESRVLLYEFKSALNRYLSGLEPQSPVHSLAELIAFNELHEDEALRYGQTLLIRAETETSGRMTEARYIRDRIQDWQASREEGIDRLLQEHRLDALLCPGVTDAPAASGYPAISVPAGCRKDGTPFGVLFMAGAFQEPLLLKLAYSFEQAYPARIPPTL